MALIVQKFGGTSVGTLERIQQVATKIAQTRAQGHDVVAVVSAMSGETDRLINLAKAVQSEPDSREYAALVATGEQVSTALLALVLQSKGCAARSYTGGQAQIHTDDNHKKARILAIDAEPLRRELNAGYVPVVAGFQGIADNGDITTLGRGGSDTTAVAIAAALDADECQIFTDVEGIYTADPRIVPKAHMLSSISFEEMLEFSSLGAKVIQQRAVEFAGQHQVPLRVLSSFADGTGTLITFNNKNNVQPLVTGIAGSGREAQITIRRESQEPEVLAEILSLLAKELIEIDIFQQRATAEAVDLTFTMARDDYAKAWMILHPLMNELKMSHILGDEKISKISLVGLGLRSHPAIISTLFKCFGRYKIVTHLVSSSETRVSVVIEENDMERSMRALHTAYGLDDTGVEEGR